jgi:hypothetical protein
MVDNDCAFSGKNAREEAEKALIQAITALLWEDRELKLKRLGYFKGFTIMSNFSGREGETPKLYLRGEHHPHQQ